MFERRGRLLARARSRPLLAQLAAPATRAPPSRSTDHELTHSSLRSSSVNTRLLLTRHERPAATEAPPLPPYATHPGAAPVAEEGGGGGLTFAREMHVLFSPRLPHSSCRFEVRAEGVVGVG